MPFIVATYVYASSQGQRTHSARIKILFVLPHKERMKFLTVNPEDNMNTSEIPKKYIESIYEKAG